jgi:hypothetical protein
MYPLQKVEEDPIWKYEELPPATLIESLRLDRVAINHDEFSRAEWFWSRRPKVLTETLTFFFCYLTGAACLLYFVPETLLLLFVWMIAGVGCVLLDQTRLTRWRNGYESSITRVIVGLSEKQ